MLGLYTWFFWLAPHALELAIILFPFTYYLLYLGLEVNSRKHPVVWTGRRNVAWLAFALSGFFLVGPPTWVLARLRWAGHPWFYLLGYSVYVAVLAWLLRCWLAQQRGRLVILNVAPQTLEGLLPKVLSSLPGPHVFVPGRAILAEGKLIIDQDVSPSWFAAELTCHTHDPALIDALRERLEAALAEVATPPHTARRLISWLGALLAILSTQAAVLYYWYLDQY